MHLFFLVFTLLPTVFGSTYGFDTFQHPVSPEVELAPASIAIKRPIYKQVTRHEIVARQRRKAERATRTKVEARAAAASAVVYPSCSAAASNGTYIAGTGFANISPYYVNRAAPYDVTGNWVNTKTLLECVALCQQLGSSCNGVFWDATKLTCSRRTGGIPPGTSYGRQTAGAMAIRGSCSEIASAVNNATIMASCCDNTPTVQTCAATNYQNLGTACVKAPLQLSGNQLSSRLVTASTPRIGYQNCIQACANVTTAAYTAQTSNGQCLGVMYDSTNSLSANLNCYLQGNNLASTTVATTNTNLISFMSGFCQQQTLGSGTYSSAYRSTTAGCDSQQPIAA